MNTSAFAMKRGTALLAEGASMRLLAVLIAITLFAVPARADPDQTLQALQREQLAERRREGLWLLGFGVASVVAGGALAIARRHDDAQLAAGVTTASFGAINAPLSLGLLDLSGARRRALLDPAPPFAQRREQAYEAQLRSGQVFALNVGLDIAYLTAAAFLLGLGHAQRGEAWERGTGAAMLLQSGFLLGFDLTCWRRVNRRAAALRVPTS